MIQSLIIPSISAEALLVSDSSQDNEKIIQFRQAPASAVLDRVELGNLIRSVLTQGELFKLQAKRTRNCSPAEVVQFRQLEVSE